MWGNFVIILDQIVIFSIEDRNHCLTGEVKGQKGKCGYLLHMMEIATRETIKTTPAAADPAIRGSCSLSSDLKSSV